MRTIPDTYKGFLIVLVSLFGTVNNLKKITKLNQNRIFTFREGGRIMEQL